VGALSTPFGSVFAAGSDRIRVGLIGCGARGTGAAMNCVLSTPGVEIVALGDVFPDRVQAALARLKDNTRGKEWDASREWRHADQVKVTPDTCFAGFDAFRKVLASDVDLVILAGPPHFRPMHLKAALEAGKNVFMEKPVAVDPAGIRSILASTELAKQKRLAIVAGTQRRHENSYVEVMKRVRNGDIGEIVAGEAYWNGPCVRTYGFYHDRQPGWTDMEYMLRNWYFYSWLSGDHIVEQHVHNLDVINWAIGSPPTEALAVGGRQWRTEPQYGNIFDHFAVRYRYPNGAVVVSQARQINDTEPRVGEGLIGTRGRAYAGRIEGAKPWKWEGPNPNPYEQEHADLIASIRAGEPLNEGKPVAEATLTAILGRMSAYTGRTVKWDFALRESELDLTPKEIQEGGYALGPAPKVPPPARGNEELI
jgi:predicted dehydrogenase